MIIVPPIKTQWIKTKLVDFIKTYAKIPENWFWIEPFMWSWVVWFNIAPKNAIFSDTNPFIIKFYDDLNNWKLNFSIVRTFLENEWEHLYEQGEPYYKYVRDRFNEQGEPLDFLFLNRSCFNGMIRFNRKWWFNVPFCKKPNRFSKSYITKIVNQVKNVQNLMEINNWTFVCKDFKDTISMWNSGDFIYCDPPYIWRNVDYYDSWDENKEHDLNFYLSKFWWKFAVSTRYKNQFRENEYLNSIWKDYRIETTEHFYFVWWKESNRNPIIEALILNY